MKKRFKCEIDCADCAEKVSEAIRKIDGVTDASINFMSQKLKIEADDERFDDILKEALRVGKRIEPDFSIEF